MSEEEKGFLTRWSQRKRDAARTEPKEAAADQPTQRAEGSADAAPVEAEPPFDLESLPKLEELTANTDMTVFFRKGVPESIRNAALRKSWALDPAVRNYVNPALDYAYDWNTPGGVPGGGELAPGTDIARMVSEVFGESQQAVDKVAGITADAADDATEQMRQPDAPSPSVRLADALPQKSADAGQRNDAGESKSPALEEGHTSDDAYGEGHSFASQQDARKHGSARPK
jgi:hypothetical protein